MRPSSWLRPRWAVALVEGTQALGLFGADAPPVPPEPEGKGQRMQGVPAHDDLRARHRPILTSEGSSIHPGGVEG